mmetsp:Transcript_9501/g.22392  ORF Transcript_9501/g.22392 Transcript_9501/m.22392 type:complete len:285 (-) Transcript_9501:288-1142(-)
MARLQVQMLLDGIKLLPELINLGILLFEGLETTGAPGADALQHAIDDGDIASDGNVTTESRGAGSVEGSTNGGSSGNGSIGNGGQRLGNGKSSADGGRSGNGEAGTERGDASCCESSTDSSVAGDSKSTSGSHRGTGSDCGDTDVSCGSQGTVDGDSICGESNEVLFRTDSDGTGVDLDVLDADVSGGRSDGQGGCARVSDGVSILGEDNAGGKGGSTSDTQGSADGNITGVGGGGTGGGTGHVQSSSDGGVSAESRVPADVGSSGDIQRRGGNCGVDADATRG